MREEWLEKTLERLREKHGPVELKTINGRHFLYKVKSVYDPEKKRARKISGEYLGRVTRQGLTPPKNRVKTIHEYANAKLLSNLMKETEASLRENFPEDWRELTALAITKTIRDTPIKYVKDAWLKLHTSTELEAHLSPNTVSEKLRAVGADWDAQRRFYSGLMKDGGVYYYDMSSLFSRSVNLNLAEKGYNKDHRFLDQVSFALLFSRQRLQPVMLKFFPGSVRDVKTLRGVLEEFALDDCVLVLDRGFLSEASLEEMMSLGVGFVQPLRRNSRLADYSLCPEEAFVYRERGIRYAVKEMPEVGEGVALYLYEDVLLRGEEHSNLIRRSVAGKGGAVDERRLGKVSLLSNLGLGGEEVYGLYKGRELVEEAFDALKNVLELDKLYLGDGYAVRGYFFVCFLCLWLYFRVFGLISGAGLGGVVGVGELLFLLSKVYSVGSGGGVRLSEVPAGVERLVERLGLDILPKS
jgi:hypothetical protein